MNGFSIDEVAKKLNVSDKAIYKSISNKTFNTDFLTKCDGKTIINEEVLNYLIGVVKRKCNLKSEVEDDVAFTLAVDDTVISEIDNASIGLRIKVYTSNEYT